MRVVIDANVAIAAAISRGLCEAIFELCLEHHQIVTCEALNQEIETKLAKKLHIPASVVAEFMAVFEDNARVFEPLEVDTAVCRDPNDLMILGLVEPGQVEAIITGDKDLLIIENYQGAKILTPREFWESCQSAK